MSFVRRDAVTHARTYHDECDKEDSPAALTIDATTEIHFALQHRGLSLNETVLSIPESVGKGPHNKFEDVGTLVVFAGGEVDLQFRMIIRVYIYIFIMYVCIFV